MRFSELLTHCVPTHYAVACRDILLEIAGEKDIIEAGGKRLLMWVVRSLSKGDAGRLVLEVEASGV